MTAAGVLVVLGAGVIGGLIGATVVWVAPKGWVRRPGTRGFTAITPEEQDDPATTLEWGVESQFATHSAAVARQLAEFADGLAGNDTALRERLRQFERPIFRSPGESE